MAVKISLFDDIVASSLKIYIYIVLAFQLDVVVCHYTISYFPQDGGNKVKKRVGDGVVE